MAKKQYFIIIDTETTIKDTVADFGAVVCDKQGRIVKSCGILVHGEFDAKDLFYDKNAVGLWAKSGAEKRKAAYNQMLMNGSRSLATVAAVNRWLAMAQGAYNPILTAYNLPFDLDKCKNTGIDLTIFSDSFDLWGAAVGNVCKTKGYKKFVLENHLFNAPTEKRNMTFQTNAEAVAGYIGGGFVVEPHTALEDAQLFELPILREIVKKSKWREKIKPYNWRDFQVKDNFTEA